MAAARAAGEQRSAVARDGSGREARGEPGSERGRSWMLQSAGPEVGSWTAAARRRPEGELEEEGSQRTRSTEEPSGWRRNEG